MLSEKTNNNSNNRSSTSSSSKLCGKNKQGTSGAAKEDARFKLVPFKPQKNFLGIIGTGQVRNIFVFVVLLCTAIFVPMMDEIVLIPQAHSIFFASLLKVFVPTLHVPLG